MTSTDKAWELFGQQDPYYGVLSHSKYRGQLSAQRKQEFMESGEHYVSRLLETSERIFGKIESRKRALDFGCGVGRLVIPFSKRFSEVVGVDISDSMLAEASKNCEEAEAHNVFFEKSIADRMGDHGQFDYVNSYVVFQHIPVARGMKLIEGLLSQVASGGQAMLHMSLRRDFSISTTIKYFVKHRIWGARQIYNVLSGYPINRPAMQMNEYDLLSVIEAFGRHGLETFIALEDHNFVMTARIYGRRVLAPTAGQTDSSVIARYRSAL